MTANRRHVGKRVDNVGSSSDPFAADRVFRRVGSESAFQMVQIVGHSLGGARRRLPRSPLDRG